MNDKGNNLFREVDKKADIVKVVSAFLGGNSLQRKGKIYVALCPFHNDSNPSMQVDPNRNTYHCWACGEHGGSIDFVKKYKKLSNAFEALKEVASICSIPLPEEARASSFVSPIERDYPTELKAMEAIGKFYSLTLESKNGTAGMEYLTRRGLSKEVIEHFGIGYSPDDPKLAITALRNQGYSINTLARAGILSSSSELEDRYYHRIMFPIEDNSGHLVAFSGRVLTKDQSPSKYVNYPETGLFHKNEILYHFSKAKDEARRKGYLYIVEGFMDVIAIVRAGCYAVCGTMGTALTQEHLKAIKRLGVEVRLCLDSDEPGQIGEEKACKELLEAQIPFRVVRKFTTGKDADEVLTKGGSEVLLSQLNRLYDPFLFFLRRTLGERNMLTDSLEIQKFLSQNRRYYAALDDVSKEKDLDWLSKVCSLSKETLQKVLKNVSLDEKKTEASFPKADYLPKKKDTYHQRRYNTEKSNYDFRFSWSDDFKLTDRILAMNQMTTASPLAKGILPQLLENECAIVIVLTHSYQAFEMLQGSRLEFCFDPFHILVNLIGLEYLSHPGVKEPFHPMDYDNLKERIKAYSSVSRQSEEEDSDPLGIFDDDEIEKKDGEITLDELGESFLLSFVDGVERLPSDCFDKEAMEQNLCLHPLYFALHQLEMKKRLSGSLSEKEEIEILSLKAKIRKNSGTI